MKHNSLIVRDAEILGGTPVFAGTRVPIQTLFDYLESGQTLPEFLDDFPTVELSQARQMFQLVKESLLATA